MLCRKVDLQYVSQKRYSLFMIHNDTVQIHTNEFINLLITNKDKQYISKLRIAYSIQFHLRIIMRGSEVFLILLGFGHSLTIGIHYTYTTLSHKVIK